jgi:hypothetical protein
VPGEGVIDAGIDAPPDAMPDAMIDAPVDARPKRKPDAAIDAAEPMVAVADAGSTTRAGSAGRRRMPAGRPGRCQRHRDDATVAAIDPFAGRAATVSPRGIGSAPAGSGGIASTGSGNSSGGSQAPPGSGSDVVPGDANAPAVDGAPTTAGTAAAS